MKPQRLLHRLRAARHSVFQWLLRPGVLGPVTGGALLLAFPPLEWTPLAWGALAPLLAVLEREGDPAQRRGLRVWFGAGWGMGLVLYVGHYHWMIHAMLGIAGVPLLQFLPFWLAMVGFFALGPAFALTACAWSRVCLGWSLWWTAPLAFMMVDALLLTFPFGGMPWGSLAATQTHTLMAHGIAPVLGGPGVVAILVAANAGWAALSSVPARIADSESPNLPALAAALLAATVAILIWPTPAPPSGPPENRVLRALLVPSDLGVPTPEDSSARLRHYISRTLSTAAPGSRPPRAASAPPLLVIWPESASAEDVSRGKTLVALNEVATLVDGDLILGSDTWDHGREYNSMYLVTSGAFDFQRYDKRQLVPFGEYIPAGFRTLFGRKATAGDEDYAAGDRAPVFPWRGRQLGVAICFESTLPDHMALAVRNGAQVLIVIANDAWLTPAARIHHLRLTTLRALEVGRDALFVSNGGGAAHVSGGQVVRDAPANGLPIRVEARLDTVNTLWVEWGTKMPFALAALVILVRLVVQGLVGFRRPRTPGLPMG